MSNINRTIISGNLAADPEVRYTPKGTAITTFAVGVGRAWRDDRQELQKKTTWVKVKVFGQKGETIRDHFRKGRPIIVDGHLDQESWDDKTTGKKRYELVLILDSFDFAGGESPGGRSTPPQD